MGVVGLATPWPPKITKATRHCEPHRSDDRSRDAWACERLHHSPARCLGTKPHTPKTSREEPNEISNHSQSYSKKNRKERCGRPVFHKVDFRGFLDAVSIVFKYWYLYCFLGLLHICFACFEVLHSIAIVWKYYDKPYVKHCIKSKGPKESYGMLSSFLGKRQLRGTPLVTNSLADA